jgi:hypothetical protein
MVIFVPLRVGAHNFKSADDITLIYNNFLHLHIKLSLYVYTAELDRTMSLIVDIFSIFATFLGKRALKGGVSFYACPRKKSARLRKWA